MCTASSPLIRRRRDPSSIQSLTNAFKINQLLEPLCAELSQLFSCPLHYQWLWIDMTFFFSFLILSPFPTLLWHKFGGLCRVSELGATFYCNESQKWSCYFLKEKKQCDPPTHIPPSGCKTPTPVFHPSSKHPIAKHPLRHPLPRQVEIRVRRFKPHPVSFIPTEKGKPAPGN